MAEKNRTTLIYIVKEDMTAIKFKGDAAFVYEQIVTDALKLLKQHDPEKFKAFQDIKPDRVMIKTRKVSAKEFQETNNQKEEDQE